MKNLFIFIIGTLLFACSQSTALKSEQTQNKSKESLLIKEDSTVSSKLSSNSIRFAHRMSAERAQVGVPFDIELDFTGSADSVLDTEFSTSTGLQMMGNTAESFQMNESGQADTHIITLVPQAEGIHYVNIYQPGSNQKPSVIRIIAGDKDIKEYLQTPGTLVEQEDGSKVISMKADEG